MAVICIFHPLPSLARLRITGVWCSIPVGVLAGIRRQSIQHLEREKTLFFVRLLVTHSSEMSSENRLKRTKDGRYFMSLRVSAIPTRRQRAIATLHVQKAEKGKERKRGRTTVEKRDKTLSSRDSPLIGTVVVLCLSLTFHLQTIGRLMHDDAVYLLGAFCHLYLICLTPLRAYFRARKWKEINK